MTLALLLGAGAAGAQQGPPAPGGTVTDRPAAAQVPAPVTAPTPSLEPFVPSEKISADSSVTFPVDI